MCNCNINIFSIVYVYLNICAPQGAAGAPGEAVSVLAGLSSEQLLLGRVQPYWVPDTEAPACMICGQK